MDFPTICTEDQQDPELRKLSAQVQANPALVPQYVQRDGIIFFKGRMMLPKTSAMIPVLLADFHSTVVGGNLGFTKTYKLLAANFYWKGMKNTIM